jgi:predicted RNA-binding Zn-ribbon protein involved in translation (DUF1610 family)
MKVIKEGKWKNPWSTKVTCSEASCGSELEIDEGDLKLDGYRDDSNKPTVKCPICGKETIIKDQIPLRVYEALNKRREYRSSGSGWRD